MINAPAELIDFNGAEVGSAEWWLQRLERRLIDRQVDMDLYDDYYSGRHRMKFHTARILAAFGGLDDNPFRRLRVNYCGVVVDALNERLNIDGYLFGEDERASEAAWEIWQRNKLDARFARGTRAGLVKGEFSLLVWPDHSGEPRIYVEDGREMIVAVDPADPSVRRAALKRWYDPDDRRWYATVYLPGGIFKYQSDQRPEDTLLLDSPPRWERRLVGDEEWPLANKLGEVPVVPVPNKPDLGDAGESELVQVVPIQDAINANIVNVMLAGQFAAFRQKWASNVTLEVDPKTKKPISPWVIAVESMFTAPPPQPGEPETRFGEFSQTSLDGYIALHEAYVQAIATVTRVPPHYFLGASGVIPSGESLRAAETGLSHKAGERGKDLSDPTEEAMRLAFRWKAEQDSVSTAARSRFLKWASIPDAQLSVRDPETRAESAHIDALQKMLALGVPREAIWALIPASPQEIRRWKRLLAKAPPVEPPTGDSGRAATRTSNQKAA